MRAINKILAIGMLTILSVVALMELNNQNRLQNIAFKTINGEGFDLHSLKGHPALITFWSTDCPSCIEEIPDLIELHKTYANSGFKIIAVTMEYTPPNQVIAMAEAKQLPYAIVLDPDAVIAHQFGDIRLTPTSFLINPEGNIEKHILGSFNKDELIKQLNQWLAT